MDLKMRNLLPSLAKSFRKEWRVQDNQFNTFFQGTLYHSSIICPWVQRLIDWLMNTIGNKQSYELSYLWVI